MVGIFFRIMAMFGGQVSFASEGIMGRGGVNVICFFGGIFVIRVGGFNGVVLLFVALSFERGAIG